MRGEVSGNNYSLLQVSYKAIISMISRVFPFARSFQNVFCNPTYVPWFSTRVQICRKRFKNFHTETLIFLLVFFKTSAKIWNCELLRAAAFGLVLSVLFRSFGHGSSLLWTHALIPFVSRPNSLAQEGRSFVNDVCECVRDWRVRKGWVAVSSFVRYFLYNVPLLCVAYCLA